MKKCSEFEDNISIINKFITNIDKIIQSRKPYRKAENEDEEDIDMTQIAMKMIWNTSIYHFDKI